MPTQTISQPIRKFYKALQTSRGASVNYSSGSSVCVNLVISKLAFFYEKLRNLLDDVEEHLLRKNAIFRYLQRKFVAPKTQGDKLARPLVCELIRAHYLPNDTISELKVKEVSEVIDKYILLKRELFGITKSSEHKVYEKWIASIAACEIEAILSPSNDLEILQGLMYEFLKDRVIINGQSLNKTERDIQIYLAILRSLRKADHPLLEYYLFTLYFPNWSYASVSEIKNIAYQLPEKREEMAIQIRHPLNTRLLNPLKKYTVYLQVLLDISKDDPERGYRIIQMPELLEAEIKKVCNRRYKKIKSKLARGVVRSVIYIFVTKMTLAIAVEIPYELLFYSVLNYTALSINVLFPPFLMFILAIFISVPTTKNTAQIIEGVKDFIFLERNNNISIKIKAPKRRSFIKRNVFRIMYVGMFGLTFGLIISFLLRIGFHSLSIVFFLFFLCMVSFFSIRLRHRAKEMVVLDRKENVFTFIIDFFSLPIIRAGRWVSLKISKINVFLFIFDFIIETPFKYFIEMVEEWFSFIREKREDIY